MDTGMRFEMTMRLIFGEKAYHIAGLEANPSHRREWLRKAVRKFIRQIDNFDTTPRHKQMLMAELEALLTLLKGVKEPSWDAVYRLIRFSARLLGYDYVRGAICHTAAYWQTQSQYYTANTLAGGDVMQEFYDKKDAISFRSNVVDDLKSKGLSDFKIAVVLNTTENAIKQLRFNIARNKR